MVRRTKDPRARLMFVCIVLALAAVFVSPSQASASEGPEGVSADTVEEAAVASVATKESAVPRDDVAVMGIGQGVRVWTGNVPIYQCPASFCNVGYAQPGQDVALICKLGPSSWGNNWLLVLNRGYNHEYYAVGWMDRYWTTGLTFEPPPCHSAPHDGGISVLVNGVVAYQCPATNCNRSSSWNRGDLIWDFCTRSGPHPRWHLALNWSRGLMQVGWVNGNLANGTTC
jgi:hypothetical protein